MPPILPNDSIETQYAGLGEPAVYVKAVSGAVAFGAASPVVVTATIPKADAAGTIQPIVRRGKVRLRITGVDANTTIGAIAVSVNDGTNNCMVKAFPASTKAYQFDEQFETPAIENASNNGSATDGMPTNIVNIVASVAFTTTTGSGNVIADIALEFAGSD